MSVRASSTSLAVSQADDVAALSAVVGIGASAESLAPLFAFIAASVPRDGPMRVGSGDATYVAVVRGLSSAATTTLIADLQRVTSAPVTAMRRPGALEPGHVHVVTGGRWPVVENGRLRFRRASSNDHGPIDNFLESLAHEYGDGAIAVILAGAGDDGAVGVRAIRDLGGFAMAQRADTASLSEMPTSAIASGMVDCALEPDALGARAREYVAALGDDRDESRSSWQRPRPSDGSSFARQPRTAATESRPITAQRKSREAPRLLRDPAAWQALREQVLEPLLPDRSQSAPLRAWVASSSAGDDAYSLALVLAEAAADFDPTSRPRILASEVDVDALAAARRGVFSAAAIDELPAALRQYFSAVGPDRRIVDWLRETIVFARHDFFSDAPFSHLDLIVCRDLLSKLDSTMQARALKAFHGALNSGGTLLLGASDTTAAQGPLRLFDAIDRRRRIFRADDGRERREKPTRKPLGAAPAATAERAATPGASPSHPFLEPGPSFSSGQLLRQTLLDFFAPSAVLIDENHRVIYFHGSPDYLRPPPDERVFDLFAMVDPRLLPTVRGAVKRALHDRAVSVSEPADGDEQGVAVTVVPIERPGLPRLLSVTFTPRAITAPGTARTNQAVEPEQVAVAAGAAGFTASVSAREMERELVGSGDAQLESLVGDLQASNEALEASHEELATMNEELQQMNARLLLVNAELGAQAREHKTLSDDVVNLLDGTDVATLLLDRAGRVRRFTPAMRELIRLQSDDVGRPLSNFQREFEDPLFDSDVARVLASSTSAEGVARGRKDRWFLRRVTPYRTAQSVVDGAVVTFTDISARVRAEEALLQVNEDLEELVQQRTAVARLQQDIAVIANSPVPIDRAFTSTLERICRDGPWMAGHVYLVRAETAEDMVWHIGKESDRRLETVLGGRSVGLGEGVVGQVIADGKPRFTSVLESDERLAGARGRGLGVRSISVFPILVGERVVGAVELFSGEAVEAATTLLEMMHNVGTQIGRVIEREEARERVFDLAVEEQRSLGEELHDTLSQQVHGLSMLAQSIVHSLAAAGIDDERVEALVEGLVGAHRQIRLLSNGLVPVRVEAGGLSGALEEMARGWQQMHGAECVFEHEGEPDLDDDRVATALYRIAREAARNAVLHGGASRIVIRLIENVDHLTLEVRDDGQGMVAVPEDGPGMGIQIMKHRAEHVGGRLEIESSPGRGTVVRCRILSTRGMGAGSRA